MPEAPKGVFPCYENQFQVNTAKGGGDAVFSNIAHCVTFKVTFDNGVEEWYSFGEKGWVSRLMTAKSVKFAVSAKRVIGDIGNDEVANMAFANSHDAERDFQWTFPDGSTVLFSSAIFNVTDNGTGDSTGVAPLEFEVMSNGKPTVTPAA